MPAYYFEGVSDPGFEMSGIVEAADESGARLKALRFCSSVDRLQECDVVPDRHKARAIETGTVRRTGFPNETWISRTISVGAAIWGALRQERHFRMS